MDSSLHNIFNDSFSIVNTTWWIGCCYCCSQGIQEKCLVLCTLDPWNCSHIPGCPECISWIRSLPPKNIKGHKILEHTFHCSDISDCVFLPSSRKMGLYTKSKSGFGQWNDDFHLWRNST